MDLNLASSLDGVGYFVSYMDDISWKVWAYFMKPMKETLRVLYVENVRWETIKQMF